MIRRLADGLRARRRPVAAASATSAPPREDALAGASEADLRIVERALPYTMTSPERLLAVVDAVRYCVGAGIPGAFVECGVWRGGSVLAMVLTLQELGCDDRDVVLFDTFEGMTAPGEQDVSALDPPALETWRAASERGERAWPEMFGEEVFDEQSVRATVLSSGYPAERVRLVRGPVEETIPGATPDALALVRLDTDWYASTRHELEHLYPRLATGGVLIVDDYGHWEGARRAVDEYFATEAPPVLLSRIDYTGRIGVKR